MAAYIGLFLKDLTNPFFVKDFAMDFFHSMKVVPETPLALVTALPMVEKMRLERVYDELSVVPEGKALVDQVRNDPTAVVSLNKSLSARGGMHKMRNKLFNEGGFEMEAGPLRIASYSTHAELASTMIHELRHRQQITEGVIQPFANKIPSPVELVWYNRVIEADAVATSIDIAYKLKEAGHPSSWDEISKGAYAGSLEAYAARVAQDPAALNDGSAKREAFDGWFKDSSNPKFMSISEMYNRQGMEQFHNTVPLLNGKTPITSLDAADYKKIGASSAVNYLDLPNYKPIDDISYRKADWSEWEGKALAQYQRRYEEAKANIGTSASKFAAPSQNAPNSGLTASKFAANAAAKPVSVAPPVTVVRRPATLKM